MTAPLHPDRDEWVLADAVARMRARLRGLDRDKLVAEHARGPEEHFSAELNEILAHFRRQPPPGKYIIISNCEWEDYRIAVLSGVRGAPPRLLDLDPYPTERAAKHAVFVLRMNDLMREGEND